MLGEDGCCHKDGAVSSTSLCPWCTSLCPLCRCNECATWRAGLTLSPFSLLTIGKRQVSGWSFWGIHVNLCIWLAPREVIPLILTTSRSKGNEKKIVLLSDNHPIHPVSSTKRIHRKRKKEWLQTNLHFHSIGHTLTFKEDICAISECVFIGPESDHWLCLSVTHSLTHSLTPV